MIRYVNEITSVFTFLILCSNFVLMINMWFNKVKTPETEQNERIAKLETELKNVKADMDDKDSRLRVLEEGNVITQRSLLALMSHAINGNDTIKLQSAKDELEKYLTARK